MSMAPECNLEQVAYDVPGLVGADLANLLNEAAIAAVKEGTKQIFPRHLLVRDDGIACLQARGAVECGAMCFGAGAG